MDGTGSHFSQHIAGVDGTGSHFSQHIAGVDGTGSHFSQHIAGVGGTGFYFSQHIAGVGGTGFYFSQAFLLGWMELGPTFPSTLLGWVETLLGNWVPLIPERVFKEGMGEWGYGNMPEVTPSFHCSL